ncbi:filamentous hemagglutinin N-terminal domain-containing protein [Pseudomonadales bacterium]|nr:filamentous hemagglutinin N-terminal domain-containing protein [Pseudomonadales bacterium]
MKVLRTNSALVAGAFTLCVCQQIHAELTFSSGEVQSGAMLIDASQGVTRGVNLLHSFEVFNVRVGESATFNGPDAINNIIARVTGTGTTTIDGLLRSAITSADLFLLNPNGIAFGANAQIEVDGGLYLSTASSISFDDGSQLLISDTGASGFTAAAPSAFGFDVSPADISFSNVNVETQVIAPDAFSDAPVSKLTIVGGNILLDTARLHLVGSEIDLVAVGGQGNVSVSGSRSLIDAPNLADITIVGDPTNVDVRIETSGDPAGRFSILANDLSMTDQAFIFSDSTGTSKGPGVEIQLSGDLNIASGSRITTDALGSGGGSDLLITADTISLADFQTKIGSDNRSDLGGGGGDVMLNANSIIVSNDAQISSTTIGSGSGGHIKINVADLLITNSGAVSGQTASTGNSGGVSVNASNAVTIEGFSSGVFSSSFADTGNAGDITISAASLVLTDEGMLTAESLSPFSGAPGAVILNVGTLELSDLGSIVTSNASDLEAGGSVIITGETINISGSASAAPEIIFSGIQSSTFGEAGGGSVIVQGENINLIDGGAVEALTESLGRAGSITLLGHLVIDGARVDARTLGEGDGGDIFLSGSVLVSNGGSVDTSTIFDFSGVGNAGQINIDGASLVVIDQGSYIASRTEGLGDAGAVAIASSSVQVAAGGMISTNTLADGAAGNINITSAEVTVSGIGSSITSSTAAAAVGGSISVSATDLSISDGGVVTVIATGDGRAGDITLRASNNLDVLDRGAVLTSSKLSGGGSLNVDVVNRIYLRDSTITASSSGPEEGDDGGNITIDSISFILNNSNIVARAVQGNGGIINLFSDNFISDIGSVISATSELGNNGDVSVFSPDNSIAGAIGTLDVSFATDQVLLNEPCAARVLKHRSSLVVETGQSITIAPDDYQMVMAVSCDGDR